MNKKLLGTTILLTTLLLVLAVGPQLNAAAAPSPTGATITSDQADYPPGATVTLTGAGWAQNEAVHLVVNDDAGQTWSLSADVAADATGAFTYKFQLPTWFIANYTITATGPTSGMATTTFTDVPIGTYDQCANNLGVGYPPLPPGTCNWINGNLQKSNSVYAEGDATVQRLWLTAMVPGSTHTVTFDYATTKGGKHAYDFLTTWNWSENWITLADRCTGIAGCTTATETYTDIPDDPNVPNTIEPTAAGARQFTMRGGTLNSSAFATPIPFVGTYAGDSDTRITISFTVATSGSMCSGGTCDVALWFGAHVARTDQWTAHDGTTGAGTISGSPYHVSLALIDGASAGSRDNQMASSAVPPNGTIVIVKNAVPQSSQSFSFNLSGGNGLVNNNFSLQDTGTPPNSQSFSEPPGTYTASELNIPTGWALTNLACTVAGTGGSTFTLASPTATITLKSSDTVTCTYTDTKTQYKDLTVTKTATPTLTRTFAWGISKTVDNTKVLTAGGAPATFNYAVDVTHDTGTDSAWKVTGKITVTNPNSIAISGVNVTDAIDNGGTCTVVSGAGVTVPANDKIVLDYSCTYAAAPSPLAGTNTATAKWTASSYYGTSGSASGTAGVDFSATAPTIVDGSVTVSDTLGGSLGSVSYTDPSPTTFAYSKTFNDPAGTCTSHSNTASFKTNTSGTTGSSSVTVTDCQGADLTVTKTATPSFTRTYKWGISKSVDSAKVFTAGGAPATFNYAVDVTHDTGTDSAWGVTGKITVTNPNDWEDVTVNVSDALDKGGTCTVTGGTNVSVAAGKSVTLDYSCTSDGTSTSNTATATWDKTTYSTPNGSATGTASFAFTTPTTIVDGSVTVSDTLGGTLGTVSYTDPSPTTFTYSNTFTDPAGTCTSHENTATFTTNTSGTTGSSGVTVTDCQGADLTVEKTATPSFMRTYTWGINKSVDNAKVFTAGGAPATVNYTVDVTHDGGADILWTVDGTITVTNPNDWEDIPVTLTDTVDNGGSCVFGGYGVTDTINITIPAGTTLKLPYSCAFASGVSGTNTATATWNSATYSTPSGSASGSAGFAFATPTTIVDGSVTVSDSVAGTLGTVSYTDPSPTTFTYSKTFTDPAGTCTKHDNTATFTTNTSGTSGSSGVTVTDCQGADLTVTKTATPSFTRTFAWGISKSVDNAKVFTAGGAPATVNYTVDVTHDGGTDSLWAVAGKITVTNPNDWEDITANVSDALDKGGICTVTGGTGVLIPAGKSVTLDYSCTSDGTGTSNTATATWNSATYSTPTGSASGSAGFAFATPTTIVDGSVTVSDTLGGTLGTVSYTDPSPTTFTYSKTFTDPAGTCTKHDNTATFTTNTTGTTGSSSQTVTDCQGADLTVTKTAAGTFDRTYLWDISKAVDKTTINIAAGGTATFNYTVDVAQTGFTDSGWTLSGVITISNPNDWEDITLTGLLDGVNNGGLCSVAGPATSDGYVVPKSGSLNVDYSCSYASKPSSYSGKNTATATWDYLKYSTPTGTASGSKDFTLTQNGSTYKSVNVTDTLGGTLGSVTANDAAPFATATFKYSHDFAGVGGTCTKYDNTATITETKQTASKTVTVCVGLDLKVSKTATPTFTRTFLWDISKAVDKTHVTQVSGNVTFNYTVVVTETGFTDSAWKVKGTITVSNPNDWEAITANVADAVDNGGTCTVTGGTSVSIPASGSKTFDYTCTWTSKPTSYSGTNTATVTWDKTAAFTPNASASGKAGFAFDDGTAGNPTTVDKTITVVDDKTDPLNPVTLGTLTATDDPTSFTTHTYTYSLDLPVPAAACKSYTNTAKIKETGQSASQTVTVCKPSMITDTILCSLPNDQFKLVFTPDQLNGWKLNASNPGQFYYNIFYSGAGGTQITVTLPYPWVTQGAVPIHIYSDVTPVTTNGITCLTPGTLLPNPKQSFVTLSDYSPQAFGSVTTVTIDVPPTGSPDGFLYINIHLDYGLKGTTGYAKGGIVRSGCNTSPNDAVQKSNQAIIVIPDCQKYGFSDTAGGTANITSTNAFKKDPGIGGLVLKKTTDGSQGDPIANARVDIYLGTKLTATVYTDEDGWYMWQYKWTGKAATFTVKLTPPSGYIAPAPQNVTLKANGYLIVNFTVAPK